MKKMKASRLAALMLILVLLCGLAAAARADVATLGIYFCGKRVAEDGTETIVRLDGKFSVTQNGEEIGTIQAGKETITLPGTERIRIAPLPETVSPEWDLTKAYCEVYPEAGGTTTVSVVVDQLQDGTVAPVPTAEPAAVSGQDEEDTDAGYAEDGDTEETGEETTGEEGSGSGETTETEEGGESTGTPAEAAAGGVTAEDETAGETGEPAGEEETAHLGQGPDRDWDRNCRSRPRRFYRNQDLSWTGSPHSGKGYHSPFLGNL